jgi:hypothetical protein
MIYQLTNINPYCCPLCYIAIFCFVKASFLSYVYECILIHVTVTVNSEAYRQNENCRIDAGSQNMITKALLAKEWWSSSFLIAYPKMNILPSFINFLD